MNMKLCIKQDYRKGPTHATLLCLRTRHLRLDVEKHLAIFVVSKAYVEDTVVLFGVL
jgi:hypothetical protein